MYICKTSWNRTLKLVPSLICKFYLSKFEGEREAHFYLGFTLRSWHSSGPQESFHCCGPCWSLTNSSPRRLLGCLAPTYHTFQSTGEDWSKSGCLMLLLKARFPHSQAVESSLCHSNEHHEPYYSFHKINMPEDVITISPKSGSSDLLSQSNSRSSHLSHSVCE